MGRIPPRSLVAVPDHKGHVWRARISSRTSMQSGCSLCASMKRTGGIKRADAEANAIA